ncbi:cytochrome b/b6 domain-containing protein [Paraburkholderia caledonica]|uniref:cytochrome b/b6 domain-containing protein n=1 Tax=Paraburkholderia caledonica TaxID=134536 RepID=UPI0038B77E71
MDKGSKSLSAETAGEPVRVWDLSVRIFHWSIVTLVIAAYVTSRYNWMTWHIRLGQLTLTLLIFRILIGFWGSETARFRRFLVRPSVALAYTQSFLSHASPTHIGHTPAGGWMVITLISLLSAQVLTGLYAYNDVARVGPLFGIFSGDTSNLLVSVHGILFSVLLSFVIVHIAVVALYWLVKRRNLIRPMTTGILNLPPGSHNPRMISARRALSLFLCSVIIATLISQL